ncbi:MAG TPA: nitroreductase/quinone reductase family protein, partial [Candidatus Limnocylindrales bacterium]
MSTPAATEPVTPMPLDADPPLADLPVDGALHGFDPVAHRVFKALNRWFMIPASRAGLGAWIGSPIGGYVLLLRAKGRKSGLVRETPLSYLIADGSIWVLAGFGPRTDWYRNLLAEPAVEVMLPGRLVHGRASEVRSL